MGQRIIVAMSRTLHFKVETIGENIAPSARGAGSRSGVALQERVSDVSCRESRQRDETVGPLTEPLAFELGATAMLIAAVRSGKPIGKTQVAFVRLAKQQQTLRRIALSVVSDPYVAANDRLDAARTRSAIELHQTEYIAEVGQANGRHAISQRSSDSLIDANHAIHNRIFAVQAKVDETRFTHEVQFYSLTD